MSNDTYPAGKHGPGLSARRRHQPSVTMSLDARRAIALLTTVGVAVGLGDMPYGYYNLLRLAVCGFSLFLLFGSGPVRAEWQQWTLGATAVLYNPIFPVRIGDRDIWIVLNIATVVLFWALPVRKNRDVVVS